MRAAGLANPIIARLERELRARAKPDHRVRASAAMPSVGLLMAVTLLAEIGEIGRSTPPAGCARGRG